MPGFCTPGPLTPSISVPGTPLARLHPQGRPFRVCDAWASLSPQPGQAILGPLLETVGELYIWAPAPLVSTLIDLKPHVDSMSLFGLL